MAPYTTEDRAEEHPGLNVNQDTSPAQPPTSPALPERPDVEIQEVKQEVPLGQASPSQLASAGIPQTLRTQ
eukprot:4512494-Prorocentrum_lima.AAC.1